MDKLTTFLNFAFCASRDFIIVNVIYFYSMICFWSLKKSKKERKQIFFVRQRCRLRFIIFLFLSGVDSYALKDKIKLGELWICADKYYDTITDLVKNIRNCFSIGWPTKNYVAEFGYENGLVSGSIRTKSSEKNSFHKIF